MSEMNIYDFLDRQSLSEDSRDVSDYQSGEFNMEDYKQRKIEEKRQLYDLIDAGTERMKESREALMKYLAMQQHFDRYTVGNVIAIMQQRETAVQLKDFDSWKAQRASIRRGASHIKILEPYDYITPDGRKGVGCNVKKVYDVSDTTARPTVRFKQVQDKDMLLRALVYKPNVSMRVVDEIGDFRESALFDPESNTIFIRRGVEPDVFFREVARELAYADLTFSYEGASREDLRFHAECAAYMLCGKYGVSPEGVEPVMPERLKAMEAMDLRGEFTQIRNSMNEINGRIGQSLEMQRQAKAKEVRGSSR